MQQRRRRSCSLAFCACTAQRTMADPEPKAGTDSNASDKTTVRTRGGKAAASVAEPAGRTRHGGRATPDKKPAGSPRGESRASADRASGAAEASDSAVAEQPPRKGKAKGKKGGAAPADRASASAEAPEAPPAQDEQLSEDAVPEAAEEPAPGEALQTAQATKGDPAAGDPSPAYLRAQVGHAVLAAAQPALSALCGAHCERKRLFGSTDRIKAWGARVPAVEHHALPGKAYVILRMRLTAALLHANRKPWSRRLRQGQRMQMVVIQSRCARPGCLLWV